jgi:hypothetical protein
MAEEETVDRFGWRNSHKDSPTMGQEVYYFGPNIGIGIGRYSYEENRSFRPYSYDEAGVKVYDDKEIELCPHIFTNNKWGVVDACDALFEAYSADFELGGNVRNVDVLGAQGSPLSARFGFTTIDKQTYRTIDIVIPLVINDAFTQSP